ncbi:MAG: cupredoxin domain-containing protein [Candidatus Dojkabacteria bacterium]
MPKPKLVTIAVIALSAFALSACNVNNTPTDTTDDSQNQEEQVEVAVDSIAIAITDDGFEPATSTVKAGGTISWVNTSSDTVQIGSDDHPTHLLNQELSGDEFTLDLAVGESITVTVNQTGTWGFHNHLNPSMTGSVTVE